jgi:hypothetical protein
MIIQTIHIQKRLEKQNKIKNELCVYTMKEMKRLNSQTLLFP